MIGQLPTTTDNCEAQRCENRWATLIPDARFKPSLVEAIFGPEHDRELYKVCWFHYRALRSKDGVILGYKYVNGKPRAFVKEYLI